MDGVSPGPLREDDGGPVVLQPEPVEQREPKPAIPALGFPGLRYVMVAVAQIPHHETPLPRNVRFKPLLIFLQAVWQAQEAGH